MIKNFIRALLSGIVAAIIFQYTSSYFLHYIKLPDPLPGAISMGILVALLVVLMEKIIPGY